MLDRVLRLARIYQVSRSGASFVVGLKCALSLVGICGETLTEPFRSLEPSERARVAKLLGDAPVVESEGRAFPVETRYVGRKPDMPLERQMADSIASALRADAGSVTAFGRAHDYGRNFSRAWGLYHLAQVLDDDRLRASYAAHVRAGIDGPHIRLHQPHAAHGLVEGGDAEGGQRLHSGLIGPRDVALD